MFDPLSLIAGWPIKKGLDAAFNIAAREIGRHGRYALRPDAAAQTEQVLLKNAAALHAWANHLEGPSTSGSSRLRSAFIGLDCYVEPIRVRESGDNRKQAIRSLFRGLKHPLILLGRPGYGKTTTIKATCLDMLEGRSPFHNACPIPVVLRLRDFDASTSLTDQLLRWFGVVYYDQKEKPVAWDEVDPYERERLLIELVNHLAIVIFLDGFDELGCGEDTDTTAVDRIKRRFLASFKRLCDANQAGHFILTSRTADFEYTVPGATEREIRSLSEAQIYRFLNKRYGSGEKSKEIKDAIAGRRLLGAEYIPLTLNYICMLYDRYKRLFTARRDIYDKILDLLLDDWDIARDLRRSSAFINFEMYEKRRFLRNLSYELSTRYHGPAFSKLEVEDVFKSVHKDYDGLKISDFRRVFREIETHTGLFAQDGAGYAFSHKTMQEYLFAMYLIEAPEFPRDEVLFRRFPNELALMVALNDNPSTALAYLAMDRHHVILSDQVFLGPFLDRIMAEETRFRVHPYLAIAFLIIYSAINVRGPNRGVYYDAMIKRFFAFLNRDSRLDASFDALAAFYVIEAERPDKGIIELRLAIPVDTILSYNEPKRLLAPYHVYERFRHREGDDADEAAG